MKMQKKLIALSIAGIAAAPVFAQTSRVTIYGRANLGFDNYAATGATAGSAYDYEGRNRVYDHGSRLGFKGVEDLGSGLKAKFKIESGVNMDTGSVNGQSGAPNSNTAGLASRDSYLALQGGFGEIRAGRMSVHKTGGRINTLEGQIGYSGPIASGSSGSVGKPTSRTSNVLMYVSPDYSGFYARLDYIAGDETAQQGVDSNGKGWSVQANYNNGPVAVKYDYTIITIQNKGTTAPATGVPVNTGSKLLLGYFYQGKSHVGLTLNHNKRENIPKALGTFSNAGDDLTQNSWSISWEHYFGNMEPFVEYGQAAAVSGMTGATANPGESKYKYWLLGARYFFSKTTSIYANYSQIVNGKQQFADYVAAGMSSVPGNLGATSAGADPRIVGIGMMHKF